MENKKKIFTVTRETQERHTTLIRENTGGHHTPFSWTKAIDRHYETELIRAIHEARTNPDYQIAHPNECKNNPDRKILKECHPDAILRIKHECEVRRRNVLPPNVERPARLNRVG